MMNQKANLSTETIKLHCKLSEIKLQEVGNVFFVSFASNLFGKWIRKPILIRCSWLVLIDFTERNRRKGANAFCNLWSLQSQSRFPTFVHLARSSLSSSVVQLHRLRGKSCCPFNGKRERAQKNHLSLHQSHHNYGFVKCKCHELVVGTFSSITCVCVCVCACVCQCVHARMYVCACQSVCVRERERVCQCVCVCAESKNIC